MTHSTSEQAQFSSDDGETDDMLKTYPQVAALQSEPHFCNADPTRQWIKVASACLDVEGSEYMVDEEEILGFYEVAVTTPVKALSIPGSASPSFAYIRARKFKAHDHDHVLVLNTEEAEVPPQVTVKEAMVGAPLTCVD